MAMKINQVSEINIKEKSRVEGYDKVSQNSSR